MSMLTQNDCKAICHHFELGWVDHPPKPLVGGRLNEQWTHKTPKGLFVIKRLNPLRTKNKKLLRRVIQTNAIAQKASEYIKTNSALLINGSPLYQCHDTFYMVYPYVEGTVLEQNNISPFHTEAIAKVLVLLHQQSINIDLPKEQLLHATIEDMNNISNKLKHSNSDIDLQLKNIQTTLLQIIEPYEKNLPFFKKNRIISHCDLDVKNVVWDKNNQPVLIDWEYASYINKYVDLLSTAIYWSIDKDYHINDTLLRLLLSQYSQNTQTELTETQLYLGFIGMLSGWISWLFFNLNQLTLSNISPRRINTALSQCQLSFYAIPYMFEQRKSILEMSYSLHNKKL